MRYRIKITSYNNGVKRYSAWVRRNWLFSTSWNALTFLGTEVDCEITMGNREDALKAIDHHYNKDWEEATIEFEYINKPQK